MGPAVPLSRIVRAWGRIGCLGFGGPPAHIALLRELCVERERWLDERELEDAIAATNLLPGPASSQLAIYCAWRLRGIPGALAGGLAFVTPGLVAIVGLSALLLGGDPPAWVRGAAGGAGAAIPAVAAAVGLALVRPTWRRPGVARGRVAGYVLAGMAAAALLGPGLVLVLLGCGALELALRAGLPRGAAALHPAALLAASASTAGLAWTALKVGALSYGGGFVIVPLMQDDAIDRHGWMTEREFLDAVALGQITPGPVLHTVAAVGYAAAGVGGALLAAAIAFAPSFAFVLAGAGRFDRLLADARVRAFIDGAAPAALGAILGSAVPLALLLSEPWQAALLGVAMAALLVARRGVVEALLGAGVAGAALVLLGAPVP